MNQLNKTRRALVAAILSLMMCFTMLAGTTFAWFTDVVSSDNNIIQTGTLDAKLLYRNLNDVEFKDASEGAIFGVELWEPGHSVAKVIRIKNVGSLSFKYKVNLEADSLGDNGSIRLSDVIDVYVFDPEENLERYDLLSKTPIGTLTEVLNTPGGMISGALLPEGSTGVNPSGYVDYCIALRMRPEAGNEYQNLSVGNGITVTLVAGQYVYEEDSFGNDYDANAGGGEKITVKRNVRLLDNVLTDLPESAIASSRGVSFPGSPYAYINTRLFAGKHITRIGIPVKSVQALDDNQTFTLSVVKTTSNAYEYVSQHTLTLPRDQLGNFTTVNKWIYVDIDLHLAEDETLAFGMPNDTVSWGYNSVRNSTYSFRSATGGWNSPINESIYFDVIATETLEFVNTEHGIASVTKSDLLPNVLSDFPESAISGGNDVEFTNPPYSYLNQDLFSGKRITRIGIPVKRVAALDENQTFTLSVIKKGSGAYQYVKELSLKLPLDQLGDSTTVNKWIYLDFDLQLADDETLAFGGKNDTVIWAWKSGFANADYSFRDAKGGTAKGIFFDIQAETVLTYEDYLDQLREEQERLEAEKEQQRLDAELREKLSGKGISILGDSISTFTGWSNNTSYNSTIGGNAIYYNGSTDGFAAVNETWWMQTITRSGLELVVNNSWSGDEVCVRGVSRAQELHNNSGREPDIIVVYLGINDFRNKKTVDQFRAKYDEMISGMLLRYDKSDVYLCTLLYTTNVSSGVNPDDVVLFNEVISETAAKYGCNLIDLYNDTGINKDNLETYMGDKRLHPNYMGMDKITDCVMKALTENYVTDISASSTYYNGETDFSVAEQGSEPQLKLTVDYSDGTTKDILITEDMYVVDGQYRVPDFTKAGIYNAKVLYQEKETTFTINVGVLIKNEEFIYGSYFDHDRFNYTKDRLTSGEYIKIRSADALHPKQDITIKVTDTDLTNYKVTIGYFDAEGNYKGRNGIIPMVNGELTIKASEMSGPYFRVNVYIYNGRFTKVPETANIVVYSDDSISTDIPVQPDNPDQPGQPDNPDQPDQPDNPDPDPSEKPVDPNKPWAGKNITILGDSISTGGYPGMLKELSGANIQNLSVSGLRLVGGLTGKVGEVSADADLVIVFGGTNDYWHKNVNIGSPDSTGTSTFNGALRYIYNYLRTNIPDAEILFVFPPDQRFGGNPSTTDFGKGTLDDFRAAFINFCVENNVEYVDLKDTDFDCSKHSGDGVHPNTAGHQIIAEAIYEKIK